MKSNTHKKKGSFLYFCMFLTSRDNNLKVLSKKLMQTCMHSLPIKIKTSEILLCWFKKS